MPTSEPILDAEDIAAISGANGPSGYALVRCEVAELKRLALRGPAMTWRPIEGCPANTLVLVTFANGFVCLAKRYGVDGGSVAWRQDHGSRLSHAPTHWMPLPAPPEAP